MIGVMVSFETLSCAMGVTVGMAVVNRHGLVMPVQCLEGLAGQQQWAGEQAWQTWNLAHQTG